MLPPSRLSDALRDVAMVAEVSTSALGLTRTDRQASKKSDTDHRRSKAHRASWSTGCAGAADYAKKIMDYQTMAHANLETVHRCLGAHRSGACCRRMNHEKWNAAHGDIKKGFDAAVQEFVNNADAVIATAAQNIGTYQVDLPTKEEISKAYKLDFQLEPIPDSSQFKADPAIEAYLQRQFEQNVAAAHAQAQQDVMKRLADPLKALIERMDSYEKREQEIAAGKQVSREGVFRDTIIGNVHDIADVFESFNVLGDPKLNEVAQDLKVFRQIDADLLRKHGQVRAAASAKAKEILQGLGIGL